MKPILMKLSFTLLALLLAGALFAQVPQRFNYQGIARDAKGNPLSQKTLSLKLSILPTADATSAEYEEIQLVSTNEFGLYTLQIGSGNASTGEIKSVKWETGNKYIKVAIDPHGGTQFVDAGTIQLLSVPYALYADKAGMAKQSEGNRTGAVSSNATHGAGDANFLAKWTALNVIGKSRLFDNGTTVAIGTASPDANYNFHLRRTTNGGHFLMENPTPTSFGTFRMINDNPANFATFTKYGSTYPGGYSGIADKYPFANMLGYGNNGPFLNAGTGNIGFAITKGGTNKLKIHIDAGTEKLGIGGNAVPMAQVHFNNTDAIGDTLKVTTNASGHSAGDGLDLSLTDTTASIINREAGALHLGTNGVARLTIDPTGKVGVGTSSPSVRLAVNGSISVDHENLGGINSLNFGSNSNTGIARSLVVGSGARNGLGFYTGGSRRMVLDSVGRLGIGTSAPQQALDVFGNVAISGNLGVGMSNPNYAFENNYGYNYMHYGLGIATNPTGSYLLDIGNGPARFQADVRINGILNPNNALTIGNNTTIQGTLTVQSNKGVVRSNDATQLKTVLYSGGLNISLPAGSSISIPIAFSTFSAVPTISIANIAGTLSNTKFLVITVRDATVNSATVDVYNSGNATASWNGTLRALIVGPE